MHPVPSFPVLYFIVVHPVLLHRHIHHLPRVSAINIMIHTTIVRTPSDSMAIMLTASSTARNPAIFHLSSRSSADVHALHVPPRLPSAYAPAQNRIAAIPSVPAATNVAVSTIASFCICTSRLNSSFVNDRLVRTIPQASKSTHSNYHRSKTQFSPNCHVFSHCKPSF